MAQDPRRSKSRLSAGRQHSRLSEYRGLHDSPLEEDGFEPLARVFSILAHALIIVILLLPETCGRLIASLEVEAAGARPRQRSRFCHRLRGQRLPAPGNPAPIPSQK
jgi:hypothetical protein